MELLFETSRSTTIQQLQALLLTQKIRVVIGYPREQSALPAYVIMLAPEEEQPSSLGDNYESYGEVEWHKGDSPAKVARAHMDAYVASTFMNSTYRIECWSDNGDLTAYMYCILKWCLLTSRKEMFQMGWTQIRLSGVDLEPAPEYMPQPIYRRAAQITMTYDNSYQDGLDNVMTYIDVATHPENYSVDDENNIIDKEGNVIIPYLKGVVTNFHKYI